MRVDNVKIAEATIKLKPKFFLAVSMVLRVFINKKGGEVVILILKHIFYHFGRARFNLRISGVVVPRLLRIVDLFSCFVGFLRSTRLFYMPGCYFISVET